VGLFLSALTLLWLANRSLAPINSGDTGLYHLSSVRWNTTYPIVPGLGNLYGPLAYNSAFFLYAGLYEPFWFGKAYHFANGFMLLLLAFTLGFSWKRFLPGQPTPDLPNLFGVLLFAYLPYQFFQYPSNLANDLAIYALGALIGLQLSRLLFTSLFAEEENWLAFAIFWLTAAGISVKLSFIALGAAASLVAGLWLLNERKKSGAPLLQRREWLWLLVLLFSGLWVLRSYIFSGYPVYPATWGGIPVAWKVPQEEADSVARWAASWGRQPYKTPEETLGNWSWLVPKLRKGLSRLPEFLLPMGMFLGGGLIYLWRKKASPGSPAFPARLPALLFLAPPVLGLVFWFFVSPNIRFVGVAFWWLGAGGLALGLAGSRFARLGAVFSAVVLVILFGFYSFYSPWITHRSGGGFVSAPSARSSVFQTVSGLQIAIPDDRMCWDHPLPCAPYPNPRLRLLQPGDLSQGFAQASDSNE
jgi:hypothetical protein